MRKEIIFTTVLLLLVVNLIAIVSAGDVDLEINSYANHDVTVIVLDPGREDPITTLTGTTDSSAKASFEFSTTASKVDFSVAIRKNGKIIVFKKFEGYTPIGQISLIILKKEDTKEESQNDTNDTPAPNQTTEDNLTANEDPAVTINTSSENQTILNGTGEANVSDQSDTPIFKIIAYTLLTLCLIFLIVGAILFFIFKRKLRIPRDIKVRKYSEIKDEIKGKKEKAKAVDEKKIDELEDRIKEMQSEIEEIRDKKHKIKEVEEKIKEDMKELDRLKKDSE